MEPRSAQGPSDPPLWAVPTLTVLWQPSDRGCRSEESAIKPLTFQGRAQATKHMKELLGSKVSGATIGLLFTYFKCFHIIFERETEWVISAGSRGWGLPGLSGAWLWGH